MPDPLNVLIKKDQIVVSTMNSAFAGTYRVKLVASVVLFPKIREEFSFDLRLFASEDSKQAESGEGDIVVSINSSGPLNYELSERMKKAKSVELGHAKSFLDYDLSEGLVFKTDPSYSIP